MLLLSSLSSPCLWNTFIDEVVIVSYKHARCSRTVQKNDVRCIKTFIEQWSFKTCLRFLLAFFVTALESCRLEVSTWAARTLILKKWTSAIKILHAFRSNSLKTSFRSMTNLRKGHFKSQWIIAIYKINSHLTLSYCNEDYKP